MCLDLQSTVRVLVIRGSELVKISLVESSIMSVVLIFDLAVNKMAMRERF